LTVVYPDSPAVWLHLAYATRRMTGGSVNQAKAILLKKEPEFPQEFLYPFNLACYCSQLHEFKETGQWLQKAMAIDKRRAKRMAMEDEDLKPYWESQAAALDKP